jgi:hypothetical protein
MNTHADKTQENKSQSVSNGESQMQSSGESIFQFVDNRPEAVMQRKLKEMANNSPRAMQLKAFQDMANNSPQAKQTAQLQSIEDNHSAQQQNPIQKKENNTGLPDNLKTGMENLSGMSLDDVKVHRNSDKPAQLQAHAYAQGTDIHLGPGQEKHLPHEAWHVVQQKQGRVKPTMQMKGQVNVNDDAGLEKEADVMGARAISELGISTIEGSENRKINKETSTDTFQLVKENEFMSDPDLFMANNQLLIRFSEGVAQTYDFSEEGVKYLNETLQRYIANANPHIRPALKRNGIDGIKGRIMDMIYMDVINNAQFNLWTLEELDGKEGANMYIITPALEAMAGQFPKMEFEVNEEGDIVMKDGVPSLVKNQTSYYISLLARKADKPKPAAYIPAALIPYDARPEVNDYEGVDLPTGDQQSNLKFAFTAGMNGCAIAVKKKSDTEITAWHYPSPDSNPEKYKRWKARNEPTDAFTYEEYGDAQIKEENDKRIQETQRNEEVTTMMIRNTDGSWRIKSQQNIGPEGGDQTAAVLELAKIAGRQLSVGEEYDG